MGISASNVSCCYTFHTSHKNGMIGHSWGGGGGRFQNAQKHYYKKTYQKLILYKPVGKY